MLGFLPEASTRENLEHGERMLRECSHGSVWKIHNWWQDPNMYYAFESKQGARWMAEHGGPPRFMSMVSDALPPCDAPSREPSTGVVDKPGSDVYCYSCGKPFESFVKPIEFCVYRCMCTEKVVHPGCFMADSCAWCGLQYVKIIHESKRIIDL